MIWSSFHSGVSGISILQNLLQLMCFFQIPDHLANYIEKYIKFKQNLLFKSLLYVLQFISQKSNFISSCQHYFRQTCCGFQSPSVLEATIRLTSWTQFHRSKPHRFNWEFYCYFKCLNKKIYFHPFNLIFLCFSFHH